MKADKILFFPLVFALFAFAACNNADKPKDPEKMAEKANEPKTETARSEDDAQMLVEAVSTDYYEIAAADVAKSMATQAVVRDFATMMGEMHATMMNETSALATKKSYTVPAMMGDDYKAKVDDMSKWKKGKEFDTHYIDAQVELHQNVLDKLEKCVARTNDTDIKMWAQKASAAVRTHIEKARAVDAQLDNLYK